MKNDTTNMHKSEKPYGGYAWKIAKIALLCIFCRTQAEASDNIRYWFDAQFEAHITQKLKVKGEQELWYNVRMSVASI